MDGRVIADAKRRLLARKQLAKLAGQDIGSGANDFEAERPLEGLLDELRGVLTDSDLARLQRNRARQCAFEEEPVPTATSMQRRVSHLFCLHLARHSAQTAWGLRMTEANEVENVVPRSPALAAGVLVGDVVLKVGSTPVTSSGGTAVKAIKQMCEGGRCLKLSLEVQREAFETVQVQAL